MYNELENKVSWNTGSCNTGETNRGYKLVHPDDLPEELKGSDFERMYRDSYIL